MLLRNNAYVTYCEKTRCSMSKTKHSTELKTGQQIYVLKITFTWWTWKFFILVFSDVTWNQELASDPHESKGGEIRDTIPSTCCATLFRCSFWVDALCFSPCVISLSCNKNVGCRLKKVVAKRRSSVYFEQQILALLLIFHQTNLSCNKFAHVVRWVEGFCISYFATFTLVWVAGWYFTTAVVWFSFD